MFEGKCILSPFINCIYYFDVIFSILSTDSVYLLFTYRHSKVKFPYFDLSNKFLLILETKNVNKIFSTDQKIIRFN